MAGQVIGPQRARLAHRTGQRWYDNGSLGAATMIRAKRRQRSDDRAETVSRARLVELYTWLFSIVTIVLLLAIGLGWLRFD
jgi:hypothetical protein